jgi:plastocyanin domain-containing protein
MGELIISLIVVSILGHHIDESKIKKYEMIDDSGKVVKVQFSKKSEYSCPMSCSVEHFHYAKNSDHNIENVWSIESVSSSNKDETSKYNVNGSDIVSYQVVNIKQKPKRAPLISIADQQSASGAE